MSILSSRPLLAAALVAATHLYAPNALAEDDGCTTIAQGIMRCDAHSDRTREEVQAESRKSLTPANPGCWTIANGIMKCDTHSERTREEMVAELRAAQAAGQVQFVGDLSIARANVVAPTRRSATAQARAGDDAGASAPGR